METGALFIGEKRLTEYRKSFKAKILAE